MSLEMLLDVSVKGAIDAVYSGDAGLRVRATFVVDAWRRERMERKSLWRTEKLCEDGSGLTSCGKTARAASQLFKTKFKAKIAGYCQYMMRY